MDRQADSAARIGATPSLWLLVSLLLSLLVLPLFEGLYVGRALLLLGMTSSFIVVARIHDSTRGNSP
jgi:hypothetical protein